MLEIQKKFLSSFTLLLYIYYSADALYKIQLFLIHDISLSFIAKKISVGSQEHTDIYKVKTVVCYCYISTFLSILFNPSLVLEVSKRFTDVLETSFNLKNSPKCRNIFIDGLDLDVLSFVKMSLGDIRSDLT